MTFEVKHGSFGYGKRTVLNDISFSVSSGEVLAVLGSNGVGKTTLLKCMMGLLKWKSGESCLDGKNITSLSHKELWQTIAYVPQSKASAFSFSALDMVVMGRSSRLGMLSRPTEEDEAAALAAMEDIGISHLKDKMCNSMSGGELQMVLIARALTAGPQMLVLDEPESNLDFKNQLVILEVLEHLAKDRNIASIINTHYPAHALKVAHKALLLNKDGTNCYGSTQEVINESNMCASFGVNVSIHNFEVQGKFYNTVVPLSIAT